MSIFVIVGLTGLAVDVIVFSIMAILNAKRGISGDAYAVLELIGGLGTMAVLGGFGAQLLVLMLTHWHPLVALTTIVVVCGAIVGALHGLADVKE